MVRKSMLGACTGLLALALLSTTLGVPAQARAEYQHRDWGRTSAKDGALRFGCHFYKYRYVIDPPTNDWAAETFLVDPTGDKLASGALDTDSDPATGRAHFRFCSPSTIPGKFTIKMKITYNDGFDINHGWVKPSTFRLRRDS